MSDPNHLISISDVLRHMFYILEGKKPVACPDVADWARWLQTADRRVAVDKIGRTTIATVFVGIDYGRLSDKQPLVFETCIFPKDKTQYVTVQRYATWAAAQKGHTRTVAMVKQKRTVSSSARRVSN